MTFTKGQVRIRSVPMSRRLVTVTEVAAAAGVNRSTVTRWAHTGLLVTAHKTPGRTGVRLFAEQDVAELLAHRLTA